MRAVIHDINYFFLKRTASADVITNVDRNDQFLFKYKVLNSKD